MRIDETFNNNNHNENIRKKPDYNIKNKIHLWWVKQEVINTSNDNDNDNK